MRGKKLEENYIHQDYEPWSRVWFVRRSALPGRLGFICKELRIGRFDLAGATMTEKDYHLIQQSGAVMQRSIIPLDV